jgi:hypothetical protein
MHGVVHFKKEKYDVYIGRPSLFGNPFMIGRDGDRDEVCAKMLKYARTRIKHDPIFREAVRNLYLKTLGCWCAPFKCHGEVLVKLAAELTGQRYDAEQMLLKDSAEAE